ncbi:MAG: hypothetical protein V1834_00535 [Candidatus Micrarchaeota archaeon]
MPKEAAEEFCKTAKTLQDIEVEIKHEQGFVSRVTIRNPKSVMPVFLKQNADKIIGKRNEFFKRIYESNRRAGEADPDGPIKLTCEVHESEEKPGGTLFEDGVRTLIFTFKVVEH